MNVVKASQFNTNTKEVFNFRDVAHEALNIIETAKAQREKMLSDASAHLDSQRNQAVEAARKEAYEKAYEEGKKQGLEDGKKEGYDKALADTRDAFVKCGSEVLSSFKNAMVQYDQIKQQLLWQAEQSVVALAIGIAEKVIETANIDSNKVAADSVKKAIAMVSRTTDLIVKVNPNDIQHLELMLENQENVLGKYETIKFQMDETVAPGGCIVESEYGQVDSGIDTQMNRIAQELMM
ncbi:MAG: hypothetical protein JEZ07_07560 [Phycisphaerae bacterium]|nr:hypothetical protein [Phycisphaerae bacterium]